MTTHDALEVRSKYLAQNMNIKRLDTHEIEKRKQYNIIADLTYLHSFVHVPGT